MTFWRWLTTSRYTRSLEAQIEELKREKAEQKEEIARLNQALVLQMRPAPKPEQRPAVINAPRKQAANGNKQDGPKVGNWLLSKEQLEIASDIKHVRYEPQAEKRTNNSQEEA